MIFTKGIPKKPLYLKHPPVNIFRIFPLGWGFDNEVLNSTVYHPGWPKPEQVGRLTPSSLDIATVLGNSFAREVLTKQGVFDENPNLSSVMANLTQRWQNFKGQNQGIYQKWLETLGTQWADDVLPPANSADKALWQAKRLQTGLSSWTTLRHATVLVNERSAAECGEGGFEKIELPLPLGAVEPDPATFQAIADLFDSEIQIVKTALKSNTDNKENLPEWGGENNKEEFKSGIIRRLQESKEQILKYRKMAIKQIANKPLTPEEYESIFRIGSVAEHNFLVFKSLVNEDFALSTPDPVPKVVDISGGGEYHLPYLIAAVGRPAEWDLILPHFGRRQITKGVIYTFTEFIQKELMTDQVWLKSVDNEPPISWTKPFYSEKKLSCPASFPF